MARVLLVFALSCATPFGAPRATGTATQKGRSAEPVVVTFDAASDVSRTARASIFGVDFAGPYLIVTATPPAAESEAIRVAWKHTWDVYDWKLHPDSWFEGVKTPEGWTRRYEGQVVLALESGKETLRCRIQLRPPSEKLGDGGTGECQVSSGGDVSLELRS